MDERKRTDSVTQTNERTLWVKVENSLLKQILWMPPLDGVKVNVSYCFLNSRYNSLLSARNGDSSYWARIYHPNFSQTCGKIKDNNCWLGTRGSHHKVIKRTVRMVIQRQTQHHITIFLTWIIDFTIDVVMAAGDDLKLERCFDVFSDFFVKTLFLVVRQLESQFASSAIPRAPTAQQQQRQTRIFYPSIHFVLVYVFIVPRWANELCTLTSLPFRYFEQMVVSFNGRIF